MSFEKVFKAAKGAAKSTIDIAISNGMSFSVQDIPLSNNEGEFPPDDQVYEWTEAFVKDTIKHKALNEKALAGMKKKWEATHSGDQPFVPKKQASEILVILIAPSDKHIHLFCSVPKDMEYQQPNDASDHWEQENRTIHYAEIMPPEDTTVFKYRDDLKRTILNDLKKQGIYVEDEEEEEEIVNYLE
jgi:hypothetical protein